MKIKKPSEIGGLLGTRRLNRFIKKSVSILPKRYLPTIPGGVEGVTTRAKEKTNRFHVGKDYNRVKKFVKVFLAAIFCNQNDYLPSAQFRMVFNIFTSITCAMGSSR